MSRARRWHDDDDDDDDGWAGGRAVVRRTRGAPSSRSRPRSAGRGKRRMGRPSAWNKDDDDDSDYGRRGRAGTQASRAGRFNNDDEVDDDYGRSRRRGRGRGKKAPDRGRRIPSAFSDDDDEDDDDDDDDDMYRRKVGGRRSRFDDDDNDDDDDDFPRRGARGRGRRVKRGVPRRMSIAAAMSRGGRGRGKRTAFDSDDDDDDDEDYDQRSRSNTQMSAVSVRRRGDMHRIPLEIQSDLEEGEDEDDEDDEIVSRRRGRGGAESKSNRESKSNKGQSKKRGTSRRNAYETGASAAGSMNGLLKQVFEKQFGRAPTRDELEAMLDTLGNDAETSDVKLFANFAERTARFPTTREMDDAKARYRERNSISRADSESAARVHLAPRSKSELANLGKDAAKALLSGSCPTVSQLTHADSIKAFVHSPLSRKLGVVETTVVRKKKGRLSSPEWYVYVQDGDKLIMGSVRGGSGGYQISADGVTHPGGKNCALAGNAKYFGKLKTVFKGDFVPYDYCGVDDGTNPDNVGKAARKFIKQREELVYVTLTSSKGSPKGSKTLSVVIPAISDYKHREVIHPTDDGIAGVVERNERERIIELQSGGQNFNSRVAMDSVKNFILVDPEDRDPDNHILQFGKIGKNHFTMDVKYPLSLYQAFCAVLAVVSK